VLPLTATDVLKFWFFAPSEAGSWVVGVMLAHPEAGSVNTFAMPEPPSWLLLYVPMTTVLPSMLTGPDPLGAPGAVSLAVSDILAHPPTGSANTYAPEGPLATASLPLTATQAPK
jgi:hypothetical protein